MPHLKKRKYEHALEPLQEELVALQRWIIERGQRVVIVFEGRDAAGKGGVISAIGERLNGRYVRTVAFPKPGEREATQWYFQRYAAQMPAAGELVLFDRSWYNRAGVEHVMGFCTQVQYRRFLDECPRFEKLLVDDGIVLLKYWLAVDQEYQEERFGERASDPLKRWKISPVDLAARRRYAAYGRARDAMIAATHTRWAPWSVANFNDQKRGRLDLIAHLLARLPERVEPAKPLKLSPLKGKLGRETLADDSLWMERRY
jgi:polyphosphate kinase